MGATLIVDVPDPSSPEWINFPTWRLLVISNQNFSCRSSHPDVFLEKGVLKICSKFTGEHPCQRVISIKLLCNFVEITLRHGFSPVYLLHIFRAHFLRNTSCGLLLLLWTKLLGNLLLARYLMPAWVLIVVIDCRKK